MNAVFCAMKNNSCSRSTEKSTENISANPAQPNGYKIRTIGVFIMSVFGFLASTGCSIFGVESVEEAPYEVVRTDNKFEIRDYAPLVVAETRVPLETKNPGNIAFRSLFGYISGNNVSSQKIAMTAPVISTTTKNTKTSKGSSDKIAMTAPVVSEKDGDSWRYQFVLPADITIDTAPLPTSPEVTLAEIPRQRAATLRYSGRATLKAQAKHARILLQWIAQQGIEPLSDVRWAGYNAPWTLPPFRRNEVLVDIANENP